MVVREDSGNVGWWIVLWDSGNSNYYRYGGDEGKYDLEVVEVSFTSIGT